jgi:hypothetical protein
MPAAADFEFLEAQQTTGHRASVLYAFSLLGNEVALLRVGAGLATAPELPTFDKARSDFQKLSRDLAQSEYREACRAASEKWHAAVVGLLPTISDCTDVLSEVVFPHNQHTRRRGDNQGTQLYLPGLIKAVRVPFLACLQRWS